MVQSVGFEGIRKQVIALERELVDLRRDFHAHPELGLEEHRTAEIVETYLARLGLVVSRVAGTGVVALLQGDRSGKTLMLRADMDALPIHEEAEHAYRSENTGVMHACGHDGHTAMLLVTAKILAEQKGRIAGNIKFVFQPDEEGGTGARAMISQGIFERPTVDAVIGAHLMTDLETGVISVDEGVVMADDSVFEITLFGEGGHTGMPEASVDPILAAANIIQQVQAVQTRELAAQAAVSIAFGSIHAGTAANTIPGFLKLEGTIRCLFDSRKTAGESVQDRFARIINHVCEAHRIKHKLIWRSYDPPVINDPNLATIVRRAALHATIGTDRKVEPFRTMIGEDFCQFASEAPTTFYFIGARNASKRCDYPHHHSRFNFDEDALAIGVELHVASALEFLKSKS